VEWYIDALDEGLEPVVPYIFRVPKGKTSFNSPTSSVFSCVLVPQGPQSLIPSFLSITTLAGSPYSQPGL